MTTYHVCSHCWGGGNKTYISRDFSGSRRACQKFIKAHGNHGFYFITSISDLDKVRRRYGTE